MCQADLLFTYKSSIRPLLDFASVSYHALLNGKQAAELEQLQLRAMKVVFGEHVAYSTVLESGLIEELHKRRETLFRKFAYKAASNPRFSSWFPENGEVGHDLRRREKYEIPRLNTDRAYKSPIIQMRRLLNAEAYPT